MSQEYFDTMHYAVSVFKKHNEKYGNAWRQWRITSLLDLAQAKCRRAMRATDNADWEEAEEESIDAINYAAFAATLIQERREDVKT